MFEVREVVQNHQEFLKATFLQEHPTTGHSVFLQKQLEQRDDLLKVSYPLHGEEDGLMCCLERAQIRSAGAQNCDSDGNCEAADDGNHFQGTVCNEDDNSLCACSYHDSEVVCHIQRGQDQFVVGKMRIPAIKSSTRPLTL